MTVNNIRLSIFPTNIKILAKLIAANTHFHKKPSDNDCITGIITKNHLS